MFNLYNNNRGRALRLTMAIALSVALMIGNFTLAVPFAEAKTEAKAVHTANVTFDLNVVYYGVAGENAGVLEQKLADAITAAAGNTLDVVGTLNGVPTIDLGLNITGGVTVNWDATYNGRIHGSVAAGSAFIAHKRVWIGPSGLKNMGKVSSSGSGGAMFCGNDYFPVKPIAFPFTQKLKLDMENSFTIDSNYTARFMYYGFTLDKAERVRFEASAYGNYVPHIRISKADNLAGAVFSGKGFAELYLEPGDYVLCIRDESCLNMSGNAMETTITAESVPLKWGDGAYSSGAAFDENDARYASYPSGTLGQDAAHPVLVKTAEELAYFNKADTADYRYYKLAPKDGLLDLSARTWNPVRINYSGSVGHFDGNGTRIKGMNLEFYEFDESESCFHGLFRALFNIEVERLTFESPRISGVFEGTNNGEFYGVGVLSGIVYTSVKVRSVRVEAPLIDIRLSGSSNMLMLGGICGIAEGTSVLHDCAVFGGEIKVSSSGSGSGAGYILVGGIVGDSESSSVQNAASRTKISVNDARALPGIKEVYAGGVAGSAMVSSAPWCVVNSYATGSVKVTQSDSNPAGPKPEAYAGGITGYLEDSAANNYVSGAVSAASTGGNAYAGRLFGIAVADEYYVKGNDMTVGTADDGKYMIRDNWYTGDNPIGRTRGNGVPKASFDPAGGVARIKTAAQLLTDLNRTDSGHGRGAAVEAMMLHGFTQEAALAKVSKWTITPGVNGGLPVFSSDISVPDSEYVAGHQDLTNAVSGASSAKDGIVVSPDGKDVPDGTEWVTAEALNELNAAIAAANAVLNNPASSAADIKLAKAALQAALKKFNAAKRTGTGQKTTTPPPKEKVVKLPGTKISKIAVGKKSAKITFKKVAKSLKVTKYQIQYRIKGKKKWKVKTFTVKYAGSSAAKVTLKKLTRGKRYQFRVRAYQVSDGKKYYAPWSAVKTGKKIK